ncbi:ATP-binding protein [Streptomyces celluloflavus]
MVGVEASFCTSDPTPFPQGVTMPAEAQLPAITHRFPRHRRSAGRARQAFREQAVRWGLEPDLTDTAELLLGELAANAVLAATGPVRQIEVRFGLADDVLTLEVADAGDGEPVVRDPAVWDEHGRGMVLVAATDRGMGRAPAVRRGEECVGRAQSHPAEPIDGALTRNLPSCSSIGRFPNRWSGAAVEGRGQSWQVGTVRRRHPERRGCCGR